MNCDSAKRNEAHSWNAPMRIHPVAGAFSDDKLNNLCLSWQALRLQKDVSTDDLLIFDCESPLESYVNDETASSHDHVSASSSSSALSLADTIAYPANSSSYFAQKSVCHFQHDAANCNRYAQTNGSKIANAADAHDCDFDGDSGCCDGSYNESWLAHTVKSNPCEYRRLQYVDLAVPTVPRNTEAEFWEQIAWNVDVLVRLGLVEHCSLLVSCSRGSEVEIEADASTLKWMGTGGGEVLVLRLYADVGCIDAHMDECACCARQTPGINMHADSTAAAVAETWRAWWVATMCLAHYFKSCQAPDLPSHHWTDELPAAQCQRYSPVIPDATHFDSKINMNDLGSDLAFLGGLEDEEL